MEYFYLPSFKAAIKKLKKKKAYKKIVADLTFFLSNKTKDQLLQTGILISKDGLFTLHKFRLKNSVSGKGSSSGFRFYLALTISDNDNVILCSIYSKDGSQGKENLTAKEVIEILKSINKEIEALPNLESLKDW